MNKPIKLIKLQPGIIFALLAPLLYALRSASIKSTPDLKIEQIMFLRYLFDLCILSPFFFKLRKNLILKRLPLHTTRVILMIVSAFCSIYGIKHLNLVDAILLENTMSLFIPLVLLIWHQEKITTYAWLILLIGFSSLFFILKPKLNIVNIAALASLATGFASSIITVSIRSLSKSMSSISILFYSYVFSLFILFILCIISWERMPTILPTFWHPFILNSLFGVAFQYTVIRAYSLAPPHVVGNFAYFGILFSAILGWTIWKEPIDVFQIIGAALLIGSGLLIIRGNKRELLNQIQQKE